MINARWFTEHSNWGDELNPYLISRISGEQVRLVEDPDVPKYLCVGSTIHLADDNTTVWGAGFINPDHHTVGTPKVLAVRGPKTRHKLTEDGIECPRVFGDPALLLPRFFNPKVTKRYAVGMIPHYIDKGNKWIQKLWNFPEIKKIDIQKPIEDVVKDILECEKIFSSSLHGIIAADAYGIPAYWIKFHNRLGDFKFEDYLMSVGRDLDPIVITDDTPLNDVLDSTRSYKLTIDLDELYEACPFRKETMRLSILICSIPSRIRQLTHLIYALEKQIKKKPVEILYLGDNKRMTVGAKRNKLLNMASGEYVCFIDDDDMLDDEYVDNILDAIKSKSDVIVFNVEISEDNSEYKPVVYDLNFKGDQNYPDRYERLPNHLMAIKREIAQAAGFPNKSFAEDHEFAKRIKRLAKTQTRIDKSLYFYHFDSKKSETRD